MSSTHDPPIIITGGSVTIEFDPGVFRQTVNGRLQNQEKVIKRVEINGDDIQSYDSTADGNGVTIKITYGDP
jgi:hypothetical protein